MVAMQHLNCSENGFYGDSFILLISEFLESSNSCYTALELHYILKMAYMVIVL